MDTYSYWQRQTPGTPLFPDVEWTQPEQRNRAGKLGIIGGNKLGFLAVAEAYTEATKSSTGVVRVLLPDVLRKSIPPAMTDVIFGATNLSGSLAKDASTELHAIGEWADGVLLIGDAGRSSETAILYESFVSEYTGQLTVTRDAVDLLKNTTNALIERPHTTLVVSFAQLQKIFQAVYYPKMLTFSMQLAQLVEALHKFTITYPVCIVVQHNDTILVAHEGRVVTQPWENTMMIWRGVVAAQIAATLLWDPAHPLEQASFAIARSA